MGEGQGRSVWMMAMLGKVVVENTSLGFIPRRICTGLPTVISIRHIDIVLVPTLWPHSRRVREGVKMRRWGKEAWGIFWVVNGR
jgi:hypothetical protein